MEIPLDFDKAFTVEDVDIKWLMDDSEPLENFDHKSRFVPISNLHSFLSAENPMGGSESEIHLQDNRI